MPRGVDSPRRLKQGVGGFTLVELIIVLAVIFLRVIASFYLTLNGVRRAGQAREKAEKRSAETNRLLPGPQEKKE